MGDDLEATNDDRDVLGEIIDIVRTAGLSPPITGFDLRGHDNGGEYALLTFTRDLEPGVENRIRKVLRRAPVRYELRKIGAGDGWMWRDNDGRAFFGKDGESQRAPHHDRPIDATETS